LRNSVPQRPNADAASFGRRLTETEKGAPERGSLPYPARYAFSAFRERTARRTARHIEGSVLRSKRAGDCGACRPVTADQFVEWVFLADGMNPNVRPEKWQRIKDAIRAAFIEHMGGEIADAKALRWSDCG
jgi:hypothetical protein